jgi:hypothetical protein
LKNIHLLASFFIVLFLLTACDTSTQDDLAQVNSPELEESSSPQAEAGRQENPSQQADVEIQSGERAERTTPNALKFALGTFLLDDTNYAIDADQAAQFLFLWKAARSLSESETTASQEIEAVVTQIGNNFSPEQLKEIDSMEIAFQDIGEIAEILGLEFGGGGRFADMTPEMQATMEAGRESGEFPRGGFGGGVPGGGPGGGQGAGLSPEARETAIAARGEFNRAGIGVPVPFLDALIEFLEAKAN